MTVWCCYKLHEIWSKTVNNYPFNVYKCVWSEVYYTKNALEGRAYADSASASASAATADDDDDDDRVSGQDNRL